LGNTSLSPLTKQEFAGTGLSSRREAARKLIHVTGLALPLIYFYTPRPLALEILIAIATTGVVLDFARHRHSRTTKIFNKLFSRVLRSHEHDAEGKHLNAVTWFFIAATVSVAVFPKYITIASITVALLGDAAAALIGKHFGRPRFHGKSLEGSCAFFLVTSAAMLLLPKINYNRGEYLIGVLAALVGTLAELTPVDVIDDNFVVPLSVAGSMWLLYTLMFPGMNLHFGV